MSTATADVRPEAEHRPVMASAKEPVGAPVAALYGSLLALVLVVLGIIGVRDALIGFDFVGGAQWLAPALQAINGFDRHDAVWIGSVTAAVLGVHLLLNAVRRRPRRALALGTRSAVFIDMHSMRRVVVAAAVDVDGVTDVTSASVKKRGVKVTTKATSTDQMVKDHIEAALAIAIAPLRSRPTVTVQVRKGRAS